MAVTARMGRSTPDRVLVEALRAGDERAFAELIDRHAALMLHVARQYVRSRAAAEEVVQETWLAVLGGIDGFEERAALKTWLLRILTKRAITRARRDRRTIPLGELIGEDEGPTVDPARFLDRHAPAHPGHWASPPRSWAGIPEERLLGREALGVVREAMAGLPARQRLVIALRDVEGWAPEEVCAALEISEANHRVLLHRARARVRQALEDYFEDA